MATLAPMTSPKAMAGAWRALAARPVASSSGSAPASRRARAKGLTRRATAAGPRCSANASAPQTMPATPAMTATAPPPAARALSTWLADEPPGQEFLGNLDGVEGGALAQVVPRHEEGQAVLHGRITPEPADDGDVRAGDGQRCRHV